MPRTNLRRLAGLAGFPLLAVAVIVPVVVWRREIWELFSSRERLSAWVDSAGALAPFLFMGLQALQVIVFVIPGEVPQIAGGYLFGAWRGSLFSVIGILAGSTLAFFMARLAGAPFVRALFPGERTERLRRLLDSPRARIAFFLLFVIPGIPKDILCYVAGISAMRFLYFVVASTLGRLPGIIGSALIGDAAARRDWWLTAALAGAALALFGAGWLLRERVQRWIERLAIRRRGDS